MADSKDTLARNIGRFTGELWRAIRSPVSGSKREVSRTVETQQRTTESGKVTLRRTMIEEIEVDRS
ncbi:MAG TPA: hypothetical protein ENJ00_08410 [Phycisphaerales bacterium]|nr:hypothetical protein [Phycisphaerales bacterium]